MFGAPLMIFDTSSAVPTLLPRNIGHAHILQAIEQATLFALIALITTLTRH